MNNNLTFEEFKEKRNSRLQLPQWFDNYVFLTILLFLKDDKKLNACKFLCDISREQGTNNIYDLKWSKLQIVDEIYRIVQDDEPYTKDELALILKPFAMLADQCLHNSNLNKDQIVYAYNHAQITMQDLRNIERVYNLLKQ